MSRNGIGLLDKNGWREITKDQYNLIITTWKMLGLNVEGGRSNTILSVEWNNIARFGEYTAFLLCAHFDNKYEMKSYTKISGRFFDPPAWDKFTLAKKAIKEILKRKNEK